MYGDIKIDKIREIKKFIIKKISTVQKRTIHIQFLANWVPRSCGLIPQPSVVTNEEMRRFAPDILIDFYEAHMVFIKSESEKQLTDSTPANSTGKSLQDPDLEKEKRVSMLKEKRRSELLIAPWNLKSKEILEEVEIAKKEEIQQKLLLEQKKDEEIQKQKERENQEVENLRIEKLEKEKAFKLQQEEISKKKIEEEKKKIISPQQTQGYYLQPKKVEVLSSSNSETNQKAEPRINIKIQQEIDKLTSPKYSQASQSSEIEKKSSSVECNTDPTKTLIKADAIFRKDYRVESTSSEASDGE